MAKFKPYKLLESQLDSLPIQEGQFILTTDTKKLYSDTAANTRILISPDAITDLSVNGTTITYTRLDGTTGTITTKDTTYSVASTTKNGLMSADDKIKLNSIESGAQANTITGVKGDSESLYRTGNVNITKANIGLSNVENKSSATIRGELTSSNVTTALGYTPLNNNLKGANNGLAELDANGKIPTTQLPSYVDDVLEYSAKASFPATGETGKIYVDTSNNKTYRWGGSAYAEISASIALGTTSSTAFRGDYGQAAYTHAVTKKGSEFSSGLYKITTNSEGHVTAATAVVKSDITGLGIPAQDTTYSAATTGTAGLMSAADKTKLDGIATGAQKNTITGVKGSAETEYRTGNINITAANIGLGNVENKSSATIRGELTKANVTTALGYTPPTQDTNTTYTLTQDANDGHKLTFTPSSGNATTITIPDNNTTYSEATTTKAGLMSSTDKTKLDGVETGAQKNTVTGVKGNSESTYRTGNVNITKANIGLGNVDNTADADKEVKYATSAGSATKATQDGDGNTITSTYLPLKGGTVTGEVKVLGTAASHSLQVRGVVGSNGEGTALDSLYLQYEANKPVHFGNTGAYTISADGSQYSGNAATATNASKVNGLTVETAVPANAKFTDTTYTGENGVTVSGTKISNSGVRSIATGTSNGTISVNTNGTSANVSVKGLANAAYKGVDTTIGAASTSTNLPTSQAVAAFVEGKGYKTTDNNTTYTFATGDANGQIKVTPSGGSAQNVSVKGLGSLAYKSSLAASDVGALASSLKGAASGVAELDANGKVPSSQLPSYVDDTVEGYLYNSKFYKESAHTTQITGETGKIYIDLSTNKTYRWSGSAFVEISASLALGTTSSTAYRGDYGNTAYQHATDANRLTTATSSGLYKVASTAQGHIASLTTVTKADITGLGIPGSDTNTTYTFATGDSNGQIKVTPSGGTASNISVKGLAAGAYKAVDTSISAASTSTNLPTSKAVAAFVEGKGYKTTDNNTTYTLTQDSTDGHKITLTPSSGTATTITIPDNNTTYTFSNGLSASGTTVSNSGVRSVATGDNNGTIKVNTNGTSANVTVKGLAAAAYKGVDTSMTKTSTSTNVPTTKAVADLIKSEIENVSVDGMIISSNDTVENIITLTKAEYEALSTKTANTLYNITDDGDTSSVGGVSTVATSLTCALPENL